MNFKVTFRKTKLLVEVQQQFILNVKIFFKDHELYKDITTKQYDGQGVETSKTKFLRDSYF